MNRTRLSLIVLALFVFALAFPSTGHATRVIGGYTRIFEGIEHAWGTEDTPRLMKAFAIRVSLLNPDVQMFATPSNGSQSGETTKQTTSAFLDVYNLKAAVNANFYGAVGGKYADPWGLVISNGTIVSNAQAGTFSGQLLFTQEKIASLVASASNPTGIYTAVGGDADAWLLTNGVKTNPNPDVNPRTGVGISQDGKYLIMVVVDGRQSGWSEGCNAQEMGQWMLDFGAWNAMVLDGGGSSCLVRDNGSGTPLVMNQPSDGSPRAVGANLGANSVAMGTVGPAVESMNADRVDIVTRGHLNHVWLKTWTSGTGWVWTDLGGYTLDTPAIVSHEDGTLDVFYRGTDNHLWNKWWTSAGGWSAWYDLGGNILSGPAACSRTSTSMDVVARGAYDHVWKKSWISTYGWYDWEDLGSATYDSPTIVSRDTNSVDVFCRGTNDHLMVKTWVSGIGWSAWSDIGGSLTTGPAAVSRDADHIDVFYRTSAGGNLAQLTWINGVGWGTEVNLGGGLSGKPAACSTGSNNINVYVRGTTDKQYQISWNGSWGGWINQGAYY